MDNDANRGANKKLSSDRICQGGGSVYHESENREKVKIVVLLWSWWSERNNVREGNSPKDARQIRRTVEVYTAEIMQILNKKPSKILWQNHKWNKPVHETLKVNCDVVYKQDSGQGGWGYVIRDSDGDVVGAGWGKIPSVMDAFQAEMIACLQGLQVAIDIGARKIVSEIDAMLTQQAITSKD
jgi:hypothetical protein